MDQLRRTRRLRLHSAAFGALSDRIGRRPLLIAFGIGATLCTVPLLTAVSRADSALSAFGLMMIGLVIVSGYTSINAVVKAELFPARIRALGVGLPYALTVAIFGGTTEYVALGLKNIGHENWFFFYVAGCALISLLVYVFMGESSRRSHLERETRELRDRRARIRQHRAGFAEGFVASAPCKCCSSRMTRGSRRRWPSFSATPARPSSEPVAAPTRSIGSRAAIWCCWIWGCPIWTAWTCCARFGVHRRCR